MTRLSTAARRERADDELDRVFKALSDRTRRAILSRLAREGPTRVTTLAEPFQMSLPAVSKHLRVLERAELIGRSIDGRVHHCALRAAPLRDVSEWVGVYRRFWTENLDSLASYLEEEAE